MTSYLKQNLITKTIANSFKILKKKVNNSVNSSSGTNIKLTNTIYKNESLNFPEKVHLSGNTKLILIDNLITKHEISKKHKAFDKIPKISKMHNSTSAIKNGRIEKSRLQPNKILYSYKRSDHKNAKEKLAKHILQCNNNSKLDTCRKHHVVRCKKIQLPRCISAKKGGCKKKLSSPTTKHKPTAPHPSFLECCRDSTKFFKDYRKECKYMNPDIRPHKNPLSRINQWNIPVVLETNPSNVPIGLIKPLKRLNIKLPTVPGEKFDHSKKNCRISIPSATASSKKNKTDLTLYKLVSVVASYLESGFSREEIEKILHKSHKQHCKNKVKPPCQVSNNLWKIKLPHCAPTVYRPAPMKSCKKLIPPCPSYAEMQKRLIRYPKTECQVAQLKKKYSSVSIPCQKNMIHYNIDYLHKNTLNRYKKLKHPREKVNCQN